MTTDDQTAMPQLDAQSERDVSKSNHSSLSSHRRRALQQISGVLVGLGTTATVAKVGMANGSNPIRISHFLPDTTLIHRQVLAPFAEAIRSIDPTIPVTVHPRGELTGSPQKEMAALLAGETDIALLIPSSYPDRFSDTAVMARSGLFTDPLQAASVFWRLIESHALDHDPALKILGVTTVGSFTVHLKHPIGKLSQLEGKRLAATPFHTDMIRALGAEPVVSTQPLAAAEALQSGELDGVVQNWPGLLIWKTAKHLRQHIAVDLGHLPLLIAMNRSRYDALPGPVKKEIDARTGQPLSRQLAKAVATGTPGAKKAAIAAGGGMVMTPLPAERPWLEVRIQASIESWQKKHPRGAELLAAVQREIKANRN